ncbi:enoyl-CoA hydratase/isomerase family protein [Litchfieldia alkalitelluris]|uniref:enoyl-CoA hydratase/isomerase family protein n=1 Tax=Litchfieldia alkalitelluris TaxID=304268 RepID=UPI001F3CEE00|nr:enoyl-CoA hydratase [Litchfieldia alkalitelluris]
MSNDHLLVQIEGPVMNLVMNRPESLNAFSPEMIMGLTNAVKEAGENPEIRIVVLSGSGRSFSAGGDVKTMGEASPSQVYDHIGKLNECILAMRSLEKPIIAAVHGFAAGAGFNLALACDLIVAAEDSKFVLSFSQVGLISDGGGLYFLPRLIGPYRAKQLLFSGEPLLVKTAKEYGIVNDTFPLDSFKEEVGKLAFKLSKGPGKAYGMIKKIADQAAVSSLSEILEQERITQTLMVTTDDHIEGVSAFKEKRKPQFKGK